MYFVYMATTWTELATQIESKIQELTESGEWNVQSVTSLDGLSHTFYSMSELIQFYREVQAEAQALEDNETKPKYRPVSFRKSSFNR